MAAEMEPQSPQDWMSFLGRKLDKEANDTEVYCDYYDGNSNNLKFAQEKFAEVFGSLFVGWQDNFCSLVVDAVSERLDVKGFRFGDDPGADKDANEIWQRNFLDADSNAAHIDALVRGTSYLAVWADAEGEPTISPEPASQTIVQYKAGSRRELQAGLKAYVDDWGVQHATLWLPDSVYTATKGKGLEWDVDVSGAPNPLGVVPIVPLSNRSRLLTLGTKRRDAKPQTPLSELHRIIPIQDAINKIAADAIVASEFAAFPQRIITGLEPFDSVEEEQEKMLKAYVDKILTFFGEGVSFGQFEAADLSNYVRLIDMLVQHMASQSRVPFHYFLLNGGAAPSGDSIVAAEAGLVAKARERQLHFGESWESAMRLAFKVKQDKRAEEWNAETIWGDPEYRTPGALADALVKHREIGMADEILQEKAGYGPHEIERNRELIKAQRQEELKRAKEQAALTGAVGGAAPAGNGTKSGANAKNATVERQKAKGI